MSTGKSKAGRKATKARAARKVPRGTKLRTSVGKDTPGSKAPKKYAGSPVRLAAKSEHIEVIARGCLLHGSRVLLCRNLKHGYAYLPGGHVEFTESAAAAMAREFLEECAVPVRVGQLALVTEGAFATKKRWHHEINLVFHVERVGAWAEGRSGESSSRPKRRTRSGSGDIARADSLPVVQSIEAEIAFEWVDLAAMPETDIRPESVKAWLAALGHSDTAGIEWVSEITPIGQ